MKNQEQKLPPLPYTYHAADAEGDVLLFTEEQIRDYAFAAVELAQSQAAPAAPQEWKDELLDRIHLYGRACRRDGNPAWESAEGVALKAHIDSLAPQPSPSASDVRDAALDEDAEIGRYLMGLATENSKTSWPRLHKIAWSGYATTNEGEGYRHWSLREAILQDIRALKSAPAATEAGERE